MKQESKRWLLVATLFAAVFLVGGSGYNTVPVFLPVLVKQFGWSRARVSMLPSVLAASAGLGYVIVGWLLDRVAARYVMVVGALITGVSFHRRESGQLVRADDMSPICAARLGISGATLIPASLVIANWFEARRGLAMGIVAAGASAGGMSDDCVCCSHNRELGMALSLHRPRSADFCGARPSAAVRCPESSQRIG